MAVVFVSRRSARGGTLGKQAMWPLPALLYLYLVVCAVFFSVWSSVVKLYQSVLKKNSPSRCYPSIRMQQFSTAARARNIKVLHFLYITACFPGKDECALYLWTNWVKSRSGRAAFGFVVSWCCSPGEELCAVSQLLSTNASQKRLNRWEVCR